MDKQLIERLAREAGFITDRHGAPWLPVEASHMHVVQEAPCGDRLTRFATLVAEECAKIAERFGDEWDADHSTEESRSTEFYRQLRHGDVVHAAAFMVRSKFGAPLPGPAALGGLADLLNETEERAIDPSDGLH
jgi:hypothetical protein